MASRCHELAQMLLKDKDFKQTAKWMNLSLRYLKLSLNLKKEALEMKVIAELEDLEKIEEVKRMDQEGLNQRAQSPVTSA